LAPDAFVRLGVPDAQFRIRELEAELRRRDG
jgi:hypothetical protein